jgi:outer membrane receptor protein involved in Fe transport
MNIFMGNAIPTGNPLNPLTPTCALDDPGCATPLRLLGVPLPFADSTQGEDDWSDVTWRVNLDWTPNDDTLVCASVTTGYDAFLVRNLKGNALKRIPEWKFTSWTSYDFQLDAGVLTAGATWSYTGEYYDSGIERSLDEVPSRDRVDVYLSWRDFEDRWNIRAFVDNVFDDVNVNGVGTGTPATDWQRTGDSLYPRFYGLDVTYRMGG